MKSQLNETKQDGIFVGYTAHSQRERNELSRENTLLINFSLFCLKYHIVIL